jgi:hypothetical protein
LLALAAVHPQLVRELTPRRPLLAAVAAGRDQLEAALDAERRECMHANERRLARYIAAAEAWARQWPEVERACGARPLREAHRHIVGQAERWLPFPPAAASGD